MPIATEVMRLPISEKGRRQDQRVQKLANGVARRGDFVGRNSKACPYDWLSCLWGRSGYDNE